MAQNCIWLWDNTNKRWVKAQCDADGKLTISDITFPAEYPLPAAQVADLKAITSYPDPVISQTDPEQLKHIPYGYDVENNFYLPLVVDPTGILYIRGGGGTFPIFQEEPSSLKHTPHGYYAVGTSYLPFAVDVDGVLLTTEKVKNITITFIIDGSGVAITTGEKGHIEIPFACTLTGWTLMADVAGAIVIDVWKDNYANFPPTNADSMSGGGKEPTIAATNQKAQDLDISDWTTVAIAIGDILAFNVDSCTTITRATLSLKATKS
jgi:hypothetical protein